MLIKKEKIKQTTCRDLITCPHSCISNVERMYMEQWGMGETTFYFHDDKVIFVIFTGDAAHLSARKAKPLISAMVYGLLI